MFFFVSLSFFPTVFGVLRLLGLDDAFIYRYTLSG
jgi:hypothetical protein